MYLYEGIWNAQFVYTLVLLSVVIWTFLKYAFHIDNVVNAFVLAFLTMILVPFLPAANQLGTAFAILLVVGTLVVSRLYGSLSLASSAAVAAVALVVGTAALPGMY